MTGADLRALAAAATPGPWETPSERRPWIDTPVDIKVDEANWGGEGLRRMNLVMFEDDQAWCHADVDLIVWLRNHADALADLIDAAQVANGEHAWDFRSELAALGQEPPT